MTRGLTTHHDAVVVRPRVLRALDRVDVIVIDPRALYTDELTITRVRGVTNSHRTTAWEAAQFALDDGMLGPGWHKLSSIRGAGRTGEALVSPVRDPFATAVVSEARRAGVRVVSVDDDGLRSLAQGFDTLFPMTGSLDDTLADVVAQLGADGATVALVTTSEMAAQHEADITIGITRDGLPPWGADVFVPDLPAVWRILRAMPAARAASTRGVRLSMSSSAIGALMLIPGVPGYGPDSVNTGVFGGLWAGFNAGSKVFEEPLPAPEPGHEWFAPAGQRGAAAAAPARRRYRTSRLPRRIRCWHRRAWPGGPRRPPGRWPVSSSARCAPTSPTRSRRSWPPARWPAPCWARRWTPRWSAACC